MITIGRQRLQLCSEPNEDIFHGTMQHSEPPISGGMYRVGSTATITCSDSYVGGGTMTCLSNGTWSKTTTPCAVASKWSFIDLQKFVYL